MTTLNLNSFLSDLGDIEKKEYQILASLEMIHKEFSHSKLYPALAELISLHSSLVELLRAKKNFEGALPHELGEIDLENKTLHYKPLFLEDNDLKKIEGLIIWSLPFIKHEIEEGKNIYDFIDNNMLVTSVGIMPMYQDEGYYFVPDNRNSTLNVVRYEVSIYSSEKEQHRGLKTNLMKSFPQSAIQSAPESIKMEMIEEYKDLPNPATFVCETDLDFPFVESLLPIAKRKLMMHLAV